MLKKTNIILSVLLLLIIFLFNASQAQAIDSYDNFVYQEVATLTFDADDERIILSAWVNPGTGKALIGFIETGGPNELNNKIEVGSYTLSVNQQGTLNHSLSGSLQNLTAYFGSSYSIRQEHDDHGFLQWNRLFLTFDYKFNPNTASRTFIILQNISEDENTDVWFDGIQLEKAIFPNQQRPTSYSPKAKIVSPSESVTLDGQRRYYEW